MATNAEETKHLFLVVMEAILESLGIVEANQEEDDNILKEFENESQMMVASFYPPCPQPDLTLGMPPHSDYGFLTLLLQDEVEGLQIQHQDKWVTVQPIPNASVVNVGDHLEVTHKFPSFSKIWKMHTQYSYMHFITQFCKPNGYTNIHYILYYIYTKIYH